MGWGSISALQNSLQSKYTLLIDNDGTLRIIRSQQCVFYKAFSKGGLNCISYKVKDGIMG